MQMVDSKKDEIISEHTGQIRKLSISFSSNNKQIINSSAREFYEFANELLEGINLPTVSPTLEACFTTRKSPCGNGTATFSRVKLRVYQRKFELNVCDSDITKIAEFLKNSAAKVQLTMGI